MPITFSCPSGHRLTSPDSHAGKQGKCPKCGAVFRVPAGSTPAPGVAATGAAASATPAVVEGGESPLQEFADDESEHDVADGEVVFLCPNGHRLHGPAEMVGRPGQCPHCKVRFLIPSPDEIPEDDEEPVEAPLEEFAIQIDTTAKEPSASAKSGLKAQAPPASATAKVHPSAALLGRLWTHKEQGASLEIHLGDGKVLIPDRYAAPAAHPGHALFAVREANGSHTVTAVAWEAIERIAVRQLQQLPKDLFG